MGLDIDTQAKSDSGTEESALQSSRANTLGALALVGLSAILGPGCASPKNQGEPVSPTEMETHPLFASHETASAYTVLGTSERKDSVRMTPAQLSELEQALVTSTSQLVAFPSASQNLDACRAIVDHVEQIFRESAYTVRRIEKEGVHSIIISKGEDLDFDVLFLGHLDVAPHPDLESYKPRKEGDKLYGRGISDMKAACAGMIELFLRHQDDQRLSNYGLIFTTDEQIGGFNGLAHLVQDHELRAQVVFNPDGAHPLNPSISEKGIVQLRLTTHGVAAHGSRPWEGKSAIEMLRSDIRRIEGLFDYADAARPQVISFNLGTVTGGEATNSVPVHAEATLDFRFPPTMTQAEIKEKVRSALEHSTMEVLIEADPVGVNPTDEALLDLMRALQHNGRQPSLMHETGGCDARWFTPQGSSILLMRLEGSGGMVDQEYVSIPGMVTYYQVLESFLNEVSDNFE